MVKTETKFKNDFMHILAILRNQNGLTQAELADNLNISRASIGNYEAGKRLPDIDTLIKMSHYFGVSADYLLGLSEHDAPELNGVSKYLGLSCEALDAIKNLPKGSSDLLSDLIRSTSFWDYLEWLELYVQLDTILSFGEGSDTYRSDKYMYLQYLANKRTEIMLEEMLDIHIDQLLNGKYADYFGNAKANIHQGDYDYVQLFYVSPDVISDLLSSLPPDLQKTINNIMRQKKAAETEEE